MHLYVQCHQVQIVILRHLISPTKGMANILLKKTFIISMKALEPNVRTRMIRILLVRSQISELSIKLFLF